MKSPSDGVQNGVKAVELALSRTYSDPKYYGRQNSREKQEIAKAWLKFKEDIEAAMQKKPNSGYYKNLADMMTTKMELLNTTDQVGFFLALFGYFFSSFLCRVSYFPPASKWRFFFFLFHVVVHFKFM